MIYVRKGQEDSTQKVISTFLKRVKKSNLVNRLRKTRYASKKLSHLKKKNKAIKTAAFLKKQEIESRTAR